MASAATVGVAVLVVTSAVSACTPKQEGPAPAAQKFFAALATGDTAAAADLSDNPSDAREALNAAWAGLQASHLDTQILGSKYAEDTGSISYRYTWHLPKNRIWTYDGQLKMARYEGHWQIRWSSTDLHPHLGEHQTLALRADPPKRASVNEVGGSDVLAPGYLYHYTLDASKAGAFLISTARSVVDVLHPFDDTINDPQRLAEQASGTGKPVDLITLRTDDNNNIAPALGSMPGVVITPQAELLPTDYHFAPALINQVKKAVIDELDGEAGWRVVSINQNNVDLAVLHEVQPAPAPSVSISLDRAVQNAAQHAVDNQGRQAMIVVIKPSTGEILAVAQNSAADALGPLGHHRPLPAGVDVQDGHRGCGARARYGKSQHAFGLPWPSRHRTACCSQLWRIRFGHSADVARVRQFVQHHIRQTGQPDAAAGSDAGRQQVRHGPGLPDRRPQHGHRIGAADGRSGRAHRGRIRPGQGAGLPVRYGDGRGDRGGRKGAGAQAHRGTAHRRSPVTPPRSARR